MLILCHFLGSAPALQQFLESVSWELETAPPLIMSVAVAHTHFT